MQLQDEINNSQNSKSSWKSLDLLKTWDFHKYSLSLHHCQHNMQEVRKEKRFLGYFRQHICKYDAAWSLVLAVTHAWKDFTAVKPTRDSTSCILSMCSPLLLFLPRLFFQKALSWYPLPLTMPFSYFLPHFKQKRQVFPPLQLPPSKSHVQSWRGHCEGWWKVDKKVGGGDSWGGVAIPSVIKVKKGFANGVCHHLSKTDWRL